MSPSLHVLIVDVDSHLWIKKKINVLDIFKNINPYDNFLFISENSFKFCESSGEVVGCINNSLVDEMNKISNFILPIFELCEDLGTNLKCYQIYSKEIKTPYKIKEKLSNRMIEGDWRLFDISNSEFENEIEAYFNE